MELNSNHLEMFVMSHFNRNMTFSIYSCVTCVNRIVVSEVTDLVQVVENSKSFIKMLKV